jgi:hypothetical protein
VIAADGQLADSPGRKKDDGAESPLRKEIRDDEENGNQDDVLRPVRLFTPTTAEAACMSPRPKGSPTRKNPVF